MPIKVESKNNVVVDVLNEVNFTTTNAGNCFILSGKKYKDLIVNYIPDVSNIWDSNSIEIKLLENPYLDAENDVFEVYHSLSKKGERIGWIFPITILMSNNNDFKNYKNIDSYKLAAFHNLLLEDCTIKEDFLQNGHVEINQIFSENIIICALHKLSINKIPDFNFNNCFLSLYSYGYSEYNPKQVRKKLLNKDSFVKDMRSTRHRVVLKEPKYDFSHNIFIKSLFNDYLINTESFLVRFILLYQIFELLMEEEYEVSFTKSLEKFQLNQISKNDLKEELIGVSKERELLKKMFKRTSSLEEQLKTNFASECVELFNGINRSYKKEFEDIIYDFRNLIVHQFRSVSSKNSDLEKIISLFEEISIDFLIKYTHPQST